MPFSKPLDQWQESDLLELKARQEPESRTLDYKRDSYGNTGSAKKEFLRDISSFANASGGHIIIGIDEKKGIPVSIPGLPGIDPDQELLRLENMYGNGISPRIVPTIQMGVVTLTTKGDTEAFVIVIRVPKSWVGPHMVSYDRVNRFWSRNSTGNYLLDVGEIKSAFLSADTATEQIRRFRMERLSLIGTDDTPVSLAEMSSCRMVLHLVPWSHPDTQVQFDLAQIPLSQLMTTIAWPYNQGRWNFDGKVFHCGGLPTDSYGQFFRSGAIEAVDISLISPKEISDVNSRKLIPSIAFEQELYYWLEVFLKIQSHLGVEPPIFAMLSLLDIGGYRMAIKNYYQDTQIRNQHLFVPETVVESFDAEITGIVKTLVDPVWNAADLQGSPYWKEESQSFTWAKP